MHRIMADLMSKDFEVVTRPTEENYTMHVPEANDSNAGNCGVQAVFTRLYDKQQLAAKVVTEGPFIPFYEFKHIFAAATMKPSTYPTGVRYTIEPSYLIDVDGTEVVDTLNPMGGEETYSIGRWRHIAYGSSSGGGNYRVVSHPKIAPLAMAKNAETDGGHVAIAAWVERYNANNYVWFSLLSNKRRPQAADGVDWPYVWGEPFTPAQWPTGILTNSTINGVVDLVEFDDGSIFMVTVVDNGDTTNQSLLCYRSFDYGATWTYCGKLDDAYYSLDDHAVAIERINERLVVVYSTRQSDTVDAKMYYSDDFGLTWTEGDQILTTFTTYAKQCVDLAMGRDKVLYLAINASPYVNEPNVKIYRTLDGANLSSAMETFLDFDVFSLLEDSAGGWLLIGRYTKGGEQFAYTAESDTDVITAAGHTFVDTDKIIFDTMDNETSGLNRSTIYYVRDRAGNDFKVALTSGGSAINITSDLSGFVHEILSVYNGELAVAHNENSPYTDTWTAANDPVTADYKFLTSRSVAATRIIWGELAAVAIDNHTFIDLFAVRKDAVAAATVQARSALSELRLGMWSGITQDYHSAVDGNFCPWDYTWFANFYPSTSDAEPNIHQWTLSTGGATATSVLIDDTTLNRSYLRFTTSIGAFRSYYISGLNHAYDNGLDARFSLRINSGTAAIVLFSHAAAGGTTLIRTAIVFSKTAGKIYFYDYVSGSYVLVATATPVNWTLDEWNTFHLIYKEDEIHLYRATSQYSEMLNFELVLSYTNFGEAAAGSDDILAWGHDVVDTHNEASESDWEFFCMSINTQWTSLPVDQDADIIGRRAYYYPTGLYAGMSLKFDGTYGVEDDSWTVETGAIHEMENVFNPSPSVCWKSSAYASDPLGTEPNEALVWKQEDSSGTMLQTVDGIAVFGRNWPYCLLEGSNNGTNWTSIFDSLSTPSLAYVLKFSHNGSSSYNRAAVTIPTGMPALHVNRFASTPEISYYLMATAGPEKYRIYKIAENDETNFYLDTQLAIGIANGNEVIVFSDRFYYDFSNQEMESSLWGDVPGETTFSRIRYRYFRLTIYGNSSGANFIFPDSDDGLKRIGSIHLGRVYDLPHEEWNVGISLQPMMAINESRPGRKEYRRLGASRRNISLSYTGIVERGLGVNPVVDLNRALGWGENPLVFVDDADILRYGDATPYGKYTHPNPILARMVDGYQLSRVAMSYEAEHTGLEAVDLTRNIVDVSGIRLEEVV